ncbi:MAG TPA: hypothetical protein VFC24_08255 [Casimicrobiaceae bacterium]|nr:hypothetical protein [Casimicrobiaceae bacterium]
MKSLIAAAAILSLTAALPAQARCSKHEAMPTVLDAIVVTPNGSYTVAEYEARMEHRRHLEETKVALAPVVVTPNDPFAEAPVEHTEVAQAAHASAHAPATHASVSASPGSPLHHTNLINYLRRLFF